MKKQSFYPLLESISLENPRYKFPAHSINHELVSMLLGQEEFDYFMINAFNKLKKDYGFAIAHIFLTLIDTKIETDKIHQIDYIEYSEKISSFIDTLQNLYITRIEKDSPDGELLKAMS